MLPECGRSLTGNIGPPKIVIAEVLQGVEKNREADLINSFTTMLEDASGYSTPLTVGRGVNSEQQVEHSVGNGMLPKAEQDGYCMVYEPY